jgi:hypothetical protein
MTLDSIDFADPEARIGRTDVPRPEYPRPDRDRSERWMSLNGVWRFDAAGAPDRIVVPFAWETEASGIGRTWLEAASYARDLRVPAHWADARIVVCFGAVHHRAVVAVDGRTVGEHTGGYEYFEFDITEALAGRRDAVLTVEVTAPADKRDIPHGKQRSIPRDDYDGVSFTPTSGIWQSVWLEARGRTYAQSVSVRGDSLTGFDVTATLVGDAPAGADVVIDVLETGDRVVARADASGAVAARVDLAEPRLWSPADPHLYRLRVSTGTDAVVVTSGLRRFEARGEELWLNDERIYLRGVLDQGYWPETGLTAPSASDLLHDLDLAAELGYNLVRKHLKFEEPIWLHEADRRGMLVWAEPACPSRFSPAAAEAFARQLDGMVERDGNHPSIVIWGLYNEEWGLDWDIPGSPARAEAAREVYDRMRALDDTRLIVENSGWSHVRTDLVDWHYYEPDLGRWADAVADLASGAQETFPVRLAPDFVVDKSLYGDDDFPRTGIPIVNSEYGEGFTSLERMWHLRWETQELRRHDRFAGYVYTEFADVEHEAAGLLTTDRRLKDGGGCNPSDVNAETVLILDVVPRAAGADIEPSADDRAVHVRVSHHGRDALSGRVFGGWLAYGAVLPSHPAGEYGAAITALPFAVSDAVPVHVPARTTPGRFALWLVDDSGAVRARTYLDSAPVEPANRRGARPGQFEEWAQPGLPG